MSQAVFRYFQVHYQKIYYEFQFKYVRDGHSGYRAYIVTSPDYRNRNASTHDTHRIPGADGYYISWSCPVRTIEDMDRISELWCMATVLYIVHGGDLASWAGKIQDRKYTTEIHRKKSWMALFYKHKLAIQAGKNKRKGDLLMNNSCVSLPPEESTPVTLTLSSTSPAGYSYIINADETATITELSLFQANQPRIVLPGEVDGHVVRDYCLTGSRVNSYNQKHFVIPEGIRAINGGLSIGCCNHIWLPYSLKTIECCLVPVYSGYNNVLHIYPGSYAQQYAQKIGCRYVLRDEHDVNESGISDYVDTSAAPAQVSAISELKTTI